MLPDGWRRVALGEVAARVTRRNTANNDNVLTISARDGLVSQYEYFNKRVASRDVGNYYHLKRGEFAYSKSFSQGYPAGAIKRLSRYDEGVVSPLYMCFSVAHRDVDPNFLARYLESDPFYGPLRNIAKQGARAHGLLNVRPEDFFSIGVTLPPLAEQRRIAEILQAADDAVATAEAVINQTEKVKRGLAEELLTRGMPGRHARFKMTEIGEVPESWEVVPVGSLGTVSYGLTISSSRREHADQVPYLTVAALQNGHLDTSLAKQTGRLAGDERFELHRGDLLVVEGNANPDRIGRAALWNGAGLMLHQNHLIRVRPALPRCRPRWIWQAFSTRETRVQILDKAKTSSGLHTINSSVVGELKLALPPLAEQDDMLRVVDAAEDATREAHATALSLRDVRLGLGEHLLSGSLRVRG